MVRVRYKVRATIPFSVSITLDVRVKRPILSMTLRSRYRPSMKGSQTFEVGVEIMVTLWLAYFFVADAFVKSA